MDANATTPRATLGGSKLSIPYQYICFLIKRSCLFILAFILFIVLLSGITTFIIFFVLKPHEPLFTIQTAKLESYDLHVHSSKDLLLSSLVSFNFSAANPNKFGICYASSRLHVLENGLVIGMIKVAHFDQPPNSKNISVEAQVILDCFNVTQMMASEKLMQENIESRNEFDDMFQMRILGDIRVQVRLFHVTLPKLWISLDCGVAMDNKILRLDSKTSCKKWEMISNAATALFSNSSSRHISIPADTAVSQIFFNKCSVSIYI